MKLYASIDRSTAAKEFFASILPSKLVVMSLYKQLSAREKAKVELKLADLRQQTGRVWSYQIMDKQWQEEINPPLLEISVGGTISRPIPLPPSTDSPADVLCHELEQYAAKNSAEK